MSIEALLTRLAEAVEANTSALTGGTSRETYIAPPAQPAPETGDKPKRGRPPKATAAEPAPAAAAAATASFKDAADATVALAELVGRDAAVALLAKYGADKTPALKPESYAAFIADARAMIKMHAQPATTTPGAGLI